VRRSGGFLQGVLAGVTGNAVWALLSGGALLGSLAAWLHGLTELERGVLSGFAAALILAAFVVFIRRLLEGHRGWRASTGKQPIRASEEKPSQPGEGANEPFNRGHYWSPYIPTWEDEEYRLGERQKRSLAEERGLVPLSDFQDGLTANEVDPGSYSFVDSPGSVGADASRIRLKRVKSALSELELHRLKGGAIEAVGFVSKQDAHALRSTTRQSRIDLFTRRTVDAPELVTVAIHRIISCQDYLVRSSAFRFDLRLRPASSSPSPPPLAPP